MTRSLSPYRWAARAAALALLIVEMAATPPAEGGTGPAHPAKVSLMVGLGKIQRTAAAAEERISIGTSVPGGAVLTTLKAARLEITLANGSVVRVGEQSVFRVQDVADNELHASVTPLHGAVDAKVWVHASDAPGPQDISVRTPVVLTAVKGTIFHLDVSPLLGTRVRVYQGHTSVAPLAQPALADTAATAASGADSSSPTAPDSARARPDTTPMRPAPPEGAAPPPQKMHIGPPTPVEGPHPVTLEEFTVLVAALQEVTFTRDNLRSHQQSRSFDPAEDQKDEWVQWNQQRDAGGAPGGRSR